MKRILLIMMVGVLSFCSAQDIRGIEWQKAGLLPVPKGFDKSIGVSGAMAGFIGEYLVIVGGANFPYKPLTEGGGKEFYNDIFVMKVNTDNTLSNIDTGILPKKLATGIAIQSDKGLYIVGGENASGDSDSVYLITLQGTKPMVKEIAKLPFTWAAGAAFINKDNLYLIGGRQDKKSSNKVWAYNLQTYTKKSLASIPGESRVQMPFTVIGNKLYLFNGLGALTLTDTYSYDFTKDTWQTLEETTLNNKSFTVAGGAAIPLTKDEILIIGGVNKEIFDDAVTQLGTLKGSALDKFKKEYFARTPEEFKFSKEMMIYNTAKNKWSSLGTLSFIGGAGPFPLVRKDNKIWHISGEIKAGVRTPEIRVGMIK